jgi:large subunit ribosomal protein L39e
MTSNKSKEKKDALSKAARMNRRIPIFVVAKTARKISRSLRSRNWRTTKLKSKVK